MEAVGCWCWHTWRGSCRQGGTLVRMLGLFPSGRGALRVLVWEGRGYICAHCLGAAWWGASWGRGPCWAAGRAGLRCGDVHVASQGRQLCGRDVGRGSVDLHG